ncbi:16S rRNA (cytidine(1402)-2'-O)-methyltransferase [Alphaproteobacteria bacterium]|nr:16S rRNA (cytidine(1402)-2'-O)-methyltransferase [Alphaproteobacteria bacterium]
MNSLEIGLYIVSTPIGNLADLSSRAKLILESVDIIICENPNHSLKLLNNLGIKKKLLSLHDYNEIMLIKRIEKYQDNSSIALISDAGSPLISDPGYNLVRDYINKNLMITAVPGASSVIPALQLSGLPIHNFIFYGFVPKNIGGIKDLIKKISSTSLTGVMFISGSRLLSFLELLSQNDDFNVSVCKEITKINEAVYRGTPRKISEVISMDTNKLKGEFVIIIAKAKSKDNIEISKHITKEMKRLLKKFSLTEVVEIVHKLTNISKKEIYSAALLIKDD